MVARLLPERSERSPLFSLELSQVSLKLTDGSILPLQFVHVADTLPGFTENTAFDHLATTRTMVASSVDSIIINGRTNAVKPSHLLGTGDDRLRLSFDLVDAQTGRLIRKLGAERFYQRDTLHALRVADRLSGLTGREVIVRPSVIGLGRGRTDMVYTLVHVHRILRDSTGSRLVASEKGTATQSQAVPTVFAVQPNYPNPFNPSTTIRYDLPEDSHVSIVIYDVLGRKVAEVVNGYHEAGYHNVQWSTDNGQWSSGVYFARFAAMDANGNAKFARVSKLLLAK
jgi:hypothetical protein